MSSSNGNMRTVFVEAMSGERFETDIPCGVPLGKVATDFFEEQQWPTQDKRGRGQRAVVELINPEDPDRTKRLQPDTDICEAGVQNGDVLRVFPEAIAGRVDQRARETALIRDQKDMEALAEANPAITYKVNRVFAPDQYTVTFHIPSFVELRADQDSPDIEDSHEAVITLGDAYPREAPRVIWKTKIFHPNIRPSSGDVCLGILRERYLPAIGLARIVNMLFEMVQWRNYDFSAAFNIDAARWAANPKNWQDIMRIDGYPFQGPIDQLRKQYEDEKYPRLQFKRVTKTDGV